MLVGREICLYVVGIVGVFFLVLLDVCMLKATYSKCSYFIVFYRVPQMLKCRKTQKFFSLKKFSLE